jgi:hypothetical protein
MKDFVMIGAIFVFAVFAFFLGGRETSMDPVTTEYIEVPFIQDEVQRARYCETLARILAEGRIEPGINTSRVIVSQRIVYYDPNCPDQ